jgi:hypothetical protein
VSEGSDAWLRIAGKWFVVRIVCLTGRAVCERGAPTAGDEGSEAW